MNESSSNKRTHSLDSVGLAVSKGETGKYGVETMLTVVSPFVSQIGDKAMAVVGNIGILVIVETLIHSIKKIKKSI
jgi:hypothetical protein